MCGEQLLAALPAAALDGSPPRVRGTVYEDWQSFIRSGITPACAGNSGAAGVWSGPGLDHPRVCGEQGPLL